jgi:hypothetical protein
MSCSSATFGLKTGAAFLVLNRFQTLRMCYTILALDPFILRALCSSANLAGIQSGRNVLNDALADALQQASKFASLLIVHGVLASRKLAQFK